MCGFCRIVWADAFHLVVRDPSDDGKKILFRTVLGSGKSRDKRRAYRTVLPKWEYNVKDEDIHYRALFPR